MRKNWRHWSKFRKDNCQKKKCLSHRRFKNFEQNRNTNKLGKYCWFEPEKSLILQITSFRNSFGLRSLWFPFTYIISFFEWGIALNNFTACLCLTKLSPFEVINIVCHFTFLSFYLPDSLSRLVVLVKYYIGTKLNKGDIYFSYELRYFRREHFTR